MGKETQDKVLNKINSKIYQYADTDISLDSFKQSFSIDVISKYFSKVFTLQKFTSHVTNNLHIQNETEFNRGHFLRDTKNIWFELAWTALTLNLYHSKLRNFCMKKNYIDKKLLLSDFSLVTELLSDIDCEFGKSFWNIKNKLNVLQELNGLEVQREYAKELQNKGMPTRSKILLYLYSVSSEKNISYNYFNKIINNFFEGFSDPELFEYSNFKLKKNYPLKAEYFTTILKYDSNSSFIDLYETFIAITQRVLSAGIEHDNNTATFIKVLRKVSKNIEDLRLINILRSFNVVQPLTNLEKEISILNIYDDFNREKYSSVINSCQALLLENPYYFSIYEPYIESVYLLNEKINFPENSLIYKILQSYLNMLLANDKTNDSIYYLLKVTIIYSNLSWTSEIVTFILNYIVDEDSYEKSIGYLNSPIVSPITSEMYTGEAKTSFLNDLKSHSKNSLTVNIKSLLESSEEIFIQYLEGEDLSIDVRNNYLCQFYLYKKDYDKLLEHSTKALDTKNIFAYHDAISMNVLALMKVNIDQAVGQLINFYMKNKNLSALLPLMNLSKLAIKEIDKTGKWSNSINMPILFYICTVYRNSDMESRTEYAYEYYLTSHSYHRPMDLIKAYKLDSLIFDDKSIFYLKEICIPDIMKKSIFFLDPNDVEKERIEICHELIILDSGNEKDYLSEIRSREQNLYIKNEITRLEKNKIYVGIRGVKKLFEKELLDDYNRFQSIIKLDNYQMDKEITDLISNICLKVQEEPDYTELEVLNTAYLQDIQKHDVDDLFEKMLKIARDIFVKNEHHGLDVYLSTKIRHGTISNHLRKPLENEHLITLRDKQSNQYNNNIFWEQELFKLNSTDKDLIQLHLKAFSKNHDEKIKFISDELLQVSTAILRADIEGNIIENENKNALFKYFFSNVSIKYMLYKNIREEMSFDEFIDYLIQILWEMTDSNLKNVRKILTNSSKREILKNFDILQSQIESINSDTSSLKDAIVRSKAETRKSIDNLITWFARMEYSERNDYDIKNAIGIVASTFGKLGSHITVSSTDECKLKGNTLESFVDIFFNLVNNAFKHNGYLDEIPKISINIQKCEENILIEIFNDVSNSLSLNELNEKLLPIKKIYGKQQAADHLHKEGGTGFYKIEKLITKDLLIINHELDFGYRENTNIEFYVKLKLSGKDILV